MQKKIQRRMTKMSIAGATGTIDASQLTGWKDHHGTTKTGVQVNSLSSVQVGDTTILRRSNGSVASFDSAELEVAAFDILTSRGYKFKKA